MEGLDAEAPTSSTNTGYKVKPPVRGPWLEARLCRQSFYSSPGPWECCQEQLILIFPAHGKSPSHSRQLKVASASSPEPGAWPHGTDSIHSNVSAYPVTLSFPICNMGTATVPTYPIGLFEKQMSLIHAERAISRMRFRALECWR